MFERDNWRTKKTVTRELYEIQKGVISGYLIVELTCRESLCMKSIVFSV